MVTTLMAEDSATVNLGVLSNVLAVAIQQAASGLHAVTARALDKTPTMIYSN